MSEPIQITAQAKERVEAARQIAVSKLSEWGVMRVMHGVALALVLIGFTFPLATISAIGFFSAGSSSDVHLYQLGIAGWMVGLLGIGVAGAPFFIVITNRLAIALFGVANFILGIVLVPYFITSYTGMFAQLSFGYVALLVAFVVLVYAYWRRIGDEFRSLVEFDAP